MEDRYDEYKKSVQIIKGYSKIQQLKRIYESPLKNQLICYEWASLAGGVLASYLPEVYIIETHNHAVLYDGKNTWDFYANAIFEDYRYPVLLIRSPITIWDDTPIDTKILKMYYSKDVLQTASARQIGYKRIFRL